MTPKNHGQATADLSPEVNLEPAAAPPWGRWSRLKYRLREAWTSRLDPWRLTRRLPQMAHYERSSQEIEAALRPAYDEYAAAISTPDSAISLELASLALFLCQLRRPRRILDLGSGFSSWVFRFHQAQTQPAPEVWSLDDSPHWLAQTRVFLEKYQFSLSHLENWHDFPLKGQAPFDFILHDLGSMSLRQAALPRVMALAGSGAAVLLDDMQKLPYGLYARQLLRNLHLESYNLKLLMRDRFRRFPFLVLT